MDDLSFQQQSQPTYTKRSSRFPLLFLLIIILLTLAGGAYFFLLHTNGTSKKPGIEPTPTVTPAPTLTPAASISGTLSPTQSAKTTPGAGAPKRADITVDILNGSGVAGAAGKISTYLKGLGYSIGTAGNANSFDYTNLTVKVKKSKSAYLELLKKDLSSQYTVDEATTTQPESSSADAVVIVGK